MKAAAVVSEESTAKDAKKKAPSDPTSIIKLELGTILGRYDRPPPWNGKAVSLEPFGKKAAWLPSVWRPQSTHSNGGKTKFKLEVAKTPWKVVDRGLRLVQERLRTVGNEAIIAAWLNRSLPKFEAPPVKPGAKRPRGVTPDGYRQHVGTVLYRAMAANIVGGDPKQGEDVPYVSSDVVAATSRRLEQLCARLWKPKVPKLPCLDTRWPVFFRPTGWRLVDDKSIAINFDGTWWHIELRTPAPKKGRAAGQKNKAMYVWSTVRRLLVGESMRGKASAIARPSEDCWIPSTLGLMCVDKQWRALLSYRYPERPVYKAQNALVVHCGLRFFAVYQDVESMLHRGRTEFVRGGGLMTRKFQFRTQRRQITREARKYAKPGRGHKYAARMNLRSDRESMFVSDWLRRRAWRIVSVAKSRKATIMFGALPSIKDKVRLERSDLPAGVKVAVHRAPWYLFQTYLKEAAAREGVPFETYETKYHTKRCPNPACGEVSNAACDFNKWHYKCISCGRTQHIEGVALVNAIWDLVRAGRIELPDGHDYQAFFDKIEDQLQEEEHRRQEAHDETELAGLSRARNGGRSKQKKGATKARAPRRKGGSKSSSTQRL